MNPIQSIINHRNGRQAREQLLWVLQLDARCDILNRGIEDDYNSAWKYNKEVDFEVVELMLRLL